MKRNPLQSVTQKIRNTLLDMLRKKEIDKKLFNYLLVKNPQLGRFYLLPKIHKRMTNVPGDQSYTIMELALKTYDCTLITI